MIEKWNILKILSLAENLSTKKEYVYNQTACINSKPRLQRGNENLLEYDITLPLHYSFCNPTKVIETIEKAAKDGTQIKWVYQKKYMGNFVVTSIEKSLIRCMKGLIVFAEVTFNLLETEEENEENLIENEEQLNENHSKIREIAKKAKDSAIEHMKENAVAALTSGSLSEAARTICQNVSNSVFEDLTGVNVADIFNTARGFSDSIKNSDSLPVDALIECIDTIQALPTLIVQGAMR